MHYIPDDKIEELRNKLVGLKDLYSKFIESDAFSKLDQEWAETIMLSRQQLDDANDIMNINGSKCYFTALDVTLNAYRRLVKCMIAVGCKERCIMNSRCDKCVNKTACEECRENPKWANVPKFSRFKEYIPTCPRGYDDCVYDPAYIKCHHPDWYKELYGDKTPEEASRTGSCQEAFENDPDEEGYCYDDEDK